MNASRFRFAGFAAAAVAATTLLAACASFDLASAIRKPTARIVKAEVEKLDFEGATVRFDVQIDNPNPVGVRLAGFDYRLVVDGTEFLKGAVDREVEIKAGGSSVIPVPVAFKFQDLLRSVRALSDREETPYSVTTGLSFDLPLLGKVRVAATRDGTLPVVRLPEVRLASLRLEGLTLQGARVVLGLEVANPNGFGLALRSLDYRFAVGGRTWATGTSSRQAQVASRGSARIDVPVDLDFGSIGGSIRDLLQGGSQLSYALSATLGLGTTLPLLQSATVPVELSGRIGITR